jgi:excisionase family DNA binding protein
MSRCEHCQFFQIVMIQGPLPGDRLIGHCRRFPPTMGKITPLKDEVERAEMSPFPLVKASDWCGEFCQTTTSLPRHSAFSTTPKPPVQDMRLVVSAQEAAKMLGISHRTLHGLSAKGQLPAVRIGARVCYRIETLRTFVSAQER